MRDPLAPKTSRIRKIRSKRRSGKEAAVNREKTLKDGREREREREREKGFPGSTHCGWYLMWPRRPSETLLYTYLTTLPYNLSLWLSVSFLPPFSHLSPPFFVIQSPTLDLRLDFPRYQSPRRKISPSSRDDVRRWAVVRVSFIRLCIFPASFSLRFFFPRCTFTFNCEILSLERCPPSVRPNPFHPTTQ